jgi:hemerythrin-like domain-containing protein
MKITDALLGEHAVIYLLLGHLEQSAGSYESAAEARTQGALLAASLGSHAELEDELLFCELESELGAGFGPLEVMRAEHADIEGTIALLRDVDDAAEARRLAEHIAAAARGHSAKEEQVLFPLAENALGEETLLRVGELWAARRLGG